jgi:hypothetical protein
MKKWVIGCGLALLIVIVIGVGAGYWFVYRPAKAYIAGFQQLGQLAELDKQVSNTSPFTAPENGELTEAVVARFVKVQEEMQAKLGAKAAELKTKYDMIERAQKGENRSASLTEVLGAVKDLAGILVEGKRAQVNALNQAQFSLEEYHWVRQQVYAAAGVALSEVDLQGFASAVKSGKPDVEVKHAEVNPEVPERNKELVKPFAPKLQEWIALSFFGL